MTGVVGASPTASLATRYIRTMKRSPECDELTDLLRQTAKRSRASDHLAVIYSVAKERGCVK